MTGGEWTTQRERKQLAADQREQLREQIRLEKRLLRDLRYCVERSKLDAQDWRDFLALHQQHGKEGNRELWESLIPYWCQCQRLNGGVPCPADLWPEWAAGIKPKLSPEKTRTGPTTRKAPGAPRKPRSDAGQPRGTYRPRTIAA